MNYRRGLALTVCSFVTLIAIAVLSQTMSGQNATAATYKVLATVTPAEGDEPIGNLAIDAAGNIFGVTAHGGYLGSEFCQEDLGCGTVFEASRNSSGAWSITRIHIFTDSADDGALPGSGLTLDAMGNLYGVTPSGGSCPISPYGCGVVYEISPAAGGGWQTLKILYSFQGNADGYFPQGTLVFDKAGNIYGATLDGGTGNGGTVFELSPTLTGPWNKTTLYNFNGTTEGNGPSGGVVFDAAGNIYGTNISGGNQSGNCAPFGCGTAYQLSPDGSGNWTETTLWSFDASDGENPVGNFAIDAAGNLYGATVYGGPSTNACGNGCGVIYEMGKNAAGEWEEEILRYLPGSVGGFYSSPTLDGSGNLYATLLTAGEGYGAVFELTKSSKTPWPETLLYTFPGGENGGSPDMAPIFFNGSLIGTTGSGGINFNCGQPYVEGCGVVYEIQK